MDARLTPTIGTNAGQTGMCASPTSLPSLDFAVPAAMTENQQFFGRVRASGDDGELIQGRHQLTVGARVPADFEGQQGIVELNLPAGVHTIEHVFTEPGFAPVRTTWTITVAAAGGGIGAQEPVSFDVDMTDHVFSLGASITVSGSLVSRGGAVPGSVSVSASLDGVPAGSATTSATGEFALTLPAGTPKGDHTVELTSDSTPLFLAAPTLEIPITVVDERTEVTITSASSVATVYGAPIDVVTRVTAADGAGPAPTGFVALADDDDLIGIATVSSGGTATFSRIFPHRRSTAIRALYVGDGVYESATSPTVAISVGDAATETVLEVSSVTGHAGDLTAIQATVSAEAGSLLEPAGAVELMLDDEVFAVASIGADEDDTAGDGTVSYAFDTEHLPAGSLELWARFVPGDGYAASESDRVDLDLENHESRITVSPRVAISEGDRAAITARAEVLGHGGGPLMRQASGAPDADGIVVVHRGREVIGSADADRATGEAKLRIDDFPVGSRSLRSSSSRTATASPRPRRRSPTRWRQRRSTLAPSIRVTTSCPRRAARPCPRRAATSRSFRSPWPGAFAAARLCTDRPAPSDGPASRAAQLSEGVERPGVDPRSNPGAGSHRRRARP